MMTQIQLDTLPIVRSVERRDLAVLGALLLITAIVLAGPLSTGASFLAHPRGPRPVAQTRHLRCKAWACLPLPGPHP